MADRELISHLAQHPAWPELAVLAREKRDKAFDRLAKDLLRGHQISDVDVAFTRGFFRGMEFLIATPTLEDKKLEEARREEVSTVG